MEFPIPQFIERESRIVGPLTLKQFIILAIAFGIGLICYFIFSFPVFLFLSIVLGGVSLGLAFLTFQGQPLLKIVKSFFSFHFGGEKIYLWKKTSYPLYKKLEEKKETKPEKKKETVLKLQGKSRLNKLQQNIEFHL